MGFRFRLERVLAYREEMEKRALMAMSRVQRRRDQEARGLRFLSEELESLVQRWSRLEGRGISMEELRWLNGRKRDLRQQLQRQKSHLEEWEDRLEQARGRWVKARQDRKILMILRERAFEQWAAAVRKAETQLLDEVALRPHQVSSRIRQEEKGSAP